MKKIILFLLALCFPVFIKAQIKYRLPQKSNIWIANGNRYKPGDTLVCPPGVYEFIAFTNLHGNKNKPITIINGNGLVTINHNSNFHCTNCEYVHITGTGSSKYKYGFLVNHGSFAYQIDGRSSYIELDHVEANHVALGIDLKNDCTCDNKSWNDNLREYVMTGFKLHDIYIHNTSLEGMYLGPTMNRATPTYGNNYGYRVVCGNQTTYHYAFNLGSISVYNNIVDSTDNDGIQLVNADSAFVFNNHISNAGIGQVAASGQSQGFSMGTWNYGKIYGNVITKVSGVGIFFNGTGNIEISNNQILNSGIDGMFIRGDKTLPVFARKLTVRVHHNQIINAGSNGITLANNGALSDSCIFLNNKISILKGKIFNPAAGISWFGDYGGHIINAAIR